MSDKPYACDETHGKYEDDMSEKVEVTGADRAEAKEWLARKDGCDCLECQEELAYLMSRKRIAATRAERERCVAENARLREALEKIELESDCGYESASSAVGLLGKINKIARAALAARGK